MTASTERASPLSGWSEALARASMSPKAFSIRERPFTTQVNLRGDASDPAFAAAVQAAIGCELPPKANTFTRSGSVNLLWLGPSEWLAVDEPDRGDGISGALRKALAGIHSSVTDVSAARTVIEIAGSDARLVLAKGCSLDVHASVLSPPRAAQALLAKAHVILQCTDARPVFQLFARDSFADYLARWLVDAAKECAASRALDTERVATRLA